MSLFIILSVYLSVNQSIYLSNSGKILVSIKCGESVSRKNWQIVNLATYQP